MIRDLSAGMTTLNVHTNVFTFKKRSGKLISVSGFDWDVGNSSKIDLKHGISREEVEGVFKGQIWIEPDLAHSDFEERFLAFGRNINGRPVLAIFTLRMKADKILLRPITVRHMHVKEARKYEEAIAKIQDR